MRHELLTLLEHLDSPSVFGGTFIPHPCSFLCVLCCVLFCLRPVSCVPSVDSVSGLFILD